MTSPRLILITGVSKGLGRAMARLFAENGNKVIGCARSEDLLDSLRRELGEPHEFQQVDVVSDREMADFASHVVASHGPPDLLINSAALINRSAPLWELSASEFDPVIDVNVKGVTNVLRNFLPAMIERGSGVAVNFSSGWGRSTSPDVAPYCATKWAIEGLTQALSQELPWGLAAASFNPGIIDTEMLRSCFGENSADYPSPDQWAKAAVPFLDSLGPEDNGKALTCPGQ